MVVCVHACYCSRVRHRRLREIVQQLRADDTLTVGQLAQSCSVSTATIRRDLVRLEADGVLSRVHGGAFLVDEARVDADAERGFDEVAAAHAADKLAVAKAAVELVRDDDVVILDIGTTARLLAEQLAGRRLTVITSSLAVLDVLRDDAAVELILLGGSVRRTYHSLVGSLAADAAGQVRARVAFVGTSGIRRDGSVLDTSVEEVPIKRAICRAAEQVVVLADRHKLPGTGSLRVVGPEEVDVLVTNDGADGSIVAACEQAGVEVLRA